MKTIDVVGAVIINEQGKILCAKRSATMSLPGLWEFPGGKIEPGETPQESLIREIAEELGVTITVGELISDSVYEYPTIQVRLITFYARLAEGAPVAREHEALQWMDREQLRTLEWAPADLPTVDALVVIE